MTFLDSAENWWKHPLCAHDCTPVKIQFGKFKIQFVIAKSVNSWILKFRNPHTDENRDLFSVSNKSGLTRLDQYGWWRLLMINDHRCWNYEWGIMKANNRIICSIVSVPSSWTLLGTFNLTSSPGQEHSLLKIFQETHWTGFLWRESSIWSNTTLNGISTASNHSLSSSSSRQSACCGVVMNISSKNLIITKTAAWTVFASTSIVSLLATFKCKTWLRTKMLKTKQNERETLVMNSQTVNTRKAVKILRSKQQTSSKKPTCAIVAWKERLAAARL